MHGKAQGIIRALDLLMKVGPQFGYNPEPDKSWCVCPLRTQEAANESFASIAPKLNYCHGKQYVGGFVGLDAMLVRWLEPKVEEWVAGMGTLAKIAIRYPQSAYFGFMHSLQAEWQYV